MTTTSKMTFRKNSSTNKFVSAINASKKFLQKNCKEYSCGSNFPGVLTGESCMVLEQYFKLDRRSESTILSTTVLSIILSAHLSANKSVDI